jgi:serine/threonine protein phosphatase PrpC
MTRILVLHGLFSPPRSKTTAAAATGFIVNSYGGYSKKGYAPYNPKKKNQDALVMAEDPKTRSLLFCVMDGHGEDGDKVSQNIKSKFANNLFKHKDFANDIKAALTDVVAKCEADVLRGSC